MILKRLVFRSSFPLRNVLHILPLLCVVDMKRKFIKLRDIQALYNIIHYRTLTSICLKIGIDCP